jgi:hypothetical protein
MYSKIHKQFAGDYVSNGSLSERSDQGAFLSAIKHRHTRALATVCACHVISSSSCVPHTVQALILFDGVIVALF